MIFSRLKSFRILLMDSCFLFHQENHLAFYLVCGGRAPISFVCNAHFRRRLIKGAKSTLLKDSRVTDGKRKAAVFDSLHWMHPHNDVLVPSLRPKQNHFSTIHAAVTKSHCSRRVGSRYFSDVCWVKENLGTRQVPRQTSRPYERSLKMRMLQK